LFQVYIIVNNLHKCGDGGDDDDDDDDDNNNNRIVLMKKFRRFSVGSSITCIARDCNYRIAATWSVAGM
jgi:hypothetical protein